MRSAVSVMQGTKFARGGQLPFELFDAVAMSEDEADKIRLEVNAQRMLAQMLAEARGGR